MKRKELYALIFSAFTFILLSCQYVPEAEGSGQELPVVRIDIPAKYLWSEDSGLYIVGSNGAPGCQGLANYNQKWEYPAMISYSIGGEEQFSSNVGFRIKGQCSRPFAQKSIGIYWRKEYGQKRLDYKLFDDVDISKFKRIVLRNSGNDFQWSHIKDACITAIFKDFANVDYQGYKPVTVFLNNEYWGIYNMREMITPHHFNYHYDVEKDEVDLLQGSEMTPGADDGSTDDYKNDIVQFLQENDLRQNEHFNEFSKRIDVDSYMDYIIVETYICNLDWPIGNVKWWRDKTSVEHKKWRWVIYDTDFGFYKKTEPDKIWIGDLHQNYTLEDRKEGFFIFNHLILNDGFKERFLDRYLFFIDVVFETERVNAIISELKNNIDSEYAKHQNKWNTLPHKRWETNVNTMKKFNAERNPIMRDLILRLMNE